MTIAQVAIDVPVPALFDYLFVGGSPADVGLRALVPFGPRQVVGVIMSVAAESGVAAHRLRPVTRVLRDVPALPAEILALLRFCSDYYHHPIGEAVMTGLPSRLRSAAPIRSKHMPDYCPTADGWNAAWGPPNRATVLRSLWERCARVGRLTGEMCADLRPPERRAFRTLLARGWIEPCAPAAIDLPAVEGHELNEEQAAVVDAVGAGATGFQAWMLHGVTGSGKTEIYFRLIACALGDQGQVLLLVPEINLTPQFEARIRARFPGTSLVSLHSGLAAGERAANWLAAQTGHARIVLGTRSAVFVPLPCLRLVVVDEEHDGSFKQLEGMRYHARDLAVWRAHARGVPIVLGSATPSLETWQHALGGRYRAARLGKRATGAQLPEVVIVPTRGRRLEDGIAPEVVAALRARLTRGEQSLVFINRRGYAPTLLCHACHWVAACHRCSARLVFHAARQQLVCHHCGHTEPVAGSCPDCGNVDLRPLGQGTQRIEALLCKSMPEARLLRVDRDSTARRSAWGNMRGLIERREVDILVGTQLMAKGHDFPGLGLVCVLDADRSLYSTDFRATEHLFAQLMQVAGRAGRGDIAGEVLIQSDFPEHPLYRRLRNHDYAGFAAELLEERRTAGFPPFVHQALLRAEASRAERVFEFLRAAAQVGRTLAEGVDVFDPAPAVLHRLKGQERGQLLVQAKSRPALHRFLERWLADLRTARAADVRWALDVDPLGV